jgi:arylsulfatase A-like enzyme
MGGHGIEGKNVFYEESMRIPMICCWKNKLHPQQTDLPVAFADLYPTMLSLMGMKDQIPSTVQSYDWSQHFLQEKIHTPRKPFNPIIIAFLPTRHPANEASVLPDTPM